MMVNDMYIIALLLSPAELISSLKETQSFVPVIVIRVVY